MPYKNKEEQKLAQQRHYQANKQVYKDRAKICTTKARKRNGKFTDRYKKLCGCSQCGYNEYAIGLDFHHINGNTDKKNSVSNMARSGIGLKLLKSEIRKCVILCAICHRVEHNGNI